MGVGEYFWGGCRDSFWIDPNERDQDLHDSDSAALKSHLELNSGNWLIRRLLGFAEDWVSSLLRFGLLVLTMCSVI